MRLLLLNNNPAVSRLIKLSVDKVGYAMDEFDDYGLVPLTNYDVIMVDNELYDEAELKALSEQVHCEYFLYICQRGSEKPALMNVSLEKPFLPTDFLTLLEKVKNVIASTKSHEEEEEDHNILVEESKEETFDIDNIDTFGVDSASVDEMSSLEELSLEEDEDSLMALDSLDEETEEQNIPTFDLDTKEEDALDLAFIKGSDKDATDDLSLSEFDFDDISSEDEAEEEDALEEKQSAPCILDRDDINEVKQLLDDDEAEQQSDALLTLEEPELDELTWEDTDEALPMLEESVAQEEDEEEIPQETECLTTTLSEELQEEDEAVANEGLDEIQEEMIDDFQEEIEEKIEDEQVGQSITMDVTKSIDTSMFSSLDDLNENVIKRAFGEEVDDEVAEDHFVASPQEVEVIRGEIESSIARSLSSLSQSDILKEALKGMRINISITFDEKN